MFILKSDDYFWAEADLVSTLLTNMWIQPEFTYEFNHKLGNGKVSLVHAEHKGLDLCVYDSPETPPVCGLFRCGLRSGHHRPV